jgi:hypothetical protein
MIMCSIDTKPLAAALHCTANLETFNLNVFELHESSSYSYASAPHKSDYFKANIYIDILANTAARK